MQFHEKIDDDDNNHNYASKPPTSCSNRQWKHGFNYKSFKWFFFTPFIPFPDVVDDHIFFSSYEL